LREPNDERGYCAVLATHVGFAKGTIVLVFVLVLVLEKVLFLPSATNYRGPIFETGQTRGSE
jgi:hypothetical protein